MLNSFNFILIENCNVISLYKVSGLSNNPMRNFDIELV